MPRQLDGDSPPPATSSVFTLLILDPSNGWSNTSIWCLFPSGRTVSRWCQRFTIRVYMVLKAPRDYQRDCFAQYGLRMDDSGRYANAIQTISSYWPRGQLLNSLYQVSRRSTRPMQDVPCGCCCYSKERPEYGRIVGWWRRFYGISKVDDRWIFCLNWRFAHWSRSWACTQKKFWG